MKRAQIERLMRFNKQIPDFCFEDSGVSNITRTKIIMLNPVRAQKNQNSPVFIMDRSTAMKLKYTIRGNVSARTKQINQWLEENVDFEGKPAVNVLFFGPKAAGKTALINRYVKDKFPSDPDKEENRLDEDEMNGEISKEGSSSSTHAPLVGPLSFGESSIRLRLFEHIDEADYAFMDVAVFVLNATQEIDEATIDLYQNVKSGLPKNCPIQFVVNKCDMVVAPATTIASIQYLFSELDRDEKPACIQVSLPHKHYPCLKTLTKEAFTLEKAAVRENQARLVHLKVRTIHYLAERIHAMNPGPLTRAWNGIKNAILRMFYTVEKPKGQQKVQEFTKILKDLTLPKEEVSMETLQSKLSDIKSVAAVHRSESGFKSLFTGLHNPTSLNVFERDLALLQSRYANDKQPPVGSSSTGNSSSK